MPGHPRTLSTIIGLVFAALTPSAALAYYPCDGAGPGEVIVGMEPNGPGQPDTPICEYVGEDGSGEGGGDPGGYWVDSYAALAWASDSAGNATYTYSYDAASQADAEQGALAECSAAGFRDCRLATYVLNGSIAVATDKDGTLHAEWGSDGGEAKSKALRLCRQRGGKGCKLDGMVDSPARWVSD
jgi:hypothetical protein